MVVATAIPAGGFVLPEGIVRKTDLVTVTEKIDALDLFAEDCNQYYNMLILTSEGRITSDRSLYLGLAEVERLNSSYAQQIHVYRAGGKINEYAFFYDEVVKSLEENPWIGKPWFNQNFHRWAELLPRASETQPGLLSYFQTPEKRARDIRTPIKPGRFLKKYFGDVLTEPQIHELALDWSNEFDTKRARITQDADEIEEIYVNGPHSCMVHRFGSQPHPSRVYAGPDLGVAYIGTTDDAAGRAVVWPDKKIYACPYGDESRMKAALEAIGYRRGDMYSFRGARLRRLTYQGEIVLPYLDIAETANDEGDYIVIGRGGDLETSNTSGLSSYEPEYNCDRCGDGVAEDDRNYIESTEEDVCGCCYNRHYFSCDGNQEAYRDEEKAELADASDHRGTFSKDYVEGSDEWFYCDHSEVWHCTEDTEEVSTYEGEDIALSVAEEEGFFCEHVGKWTLEDNFQVKLTNGKSVHMGTFANEAAFNEWLFDHGAIVGDPELIDPNQLPLPLHEAA